MLAVIRQLVRAERIYLLVILLAGLMLRTYQLDINPPALFADEASIGYNAYTLATNGTDEYGLRFPFFFKAFGEYKSPVQIYATSFSVRLLGLSEYSVRLTSVVFGLFSIIAVYLLSKTLARSIDPHMSLAQARSVGLIAACLTAISPWHVHFSRIGFEMMPYVLFSTMGLYFLLSKRHILSVAVFGLTLYTYFAARMTMPIFLTVSLVYIYMKSRSFTKTIPAILVSLLFLLPLSMHMAGGKGLARYRQASILEQTDTTSAEKILHVATVYWRHFSPDYLFTKGESGMSFLTRHSLRDMGLLYAWQAPVILLGIVWLLRQGLRHKGQSRVGLAIVIVWLFAYPVASSITSDTVPAATRSVIGIVLFQFLTAIGLLAGYAGIAKLGTFLYTRKIIVKTIQYSYIVWITAIVFSSFVPYLYRYFIVYPSYSSDFWGWQYGAKEIISYFIDHKDQYDNLYMQPEFNAPDIFFKFYDPHNTCTNCDVGWYVEEYDATKHQLFAVTPERVSILQEANPRVIDTIKYPAGNAAFFLIETVPSTPKNP